MFTELLEQVVEIDEKQRFNIGSTIVVNGRTGVVIEIDGNEGYVIEFEDTGEKKWVDAEEFFPQNDLVDPTVNYDQSIGGKEGEEISPGILSVISDMLKVLLRVVPGKE